MFLEEITYQLQEDWVEKDIVNVFHGLASIDSPLNSDLCNKTLPTIVRKLETMTSKRNLMIENKVIKYSKCSRLTKTIFRGNSIAGVVIEEYFSSKQRRWYI